MKLILSMLDMFIGKKKQDYLMIATKRHTPGLVELSEKEAQVFGFTVSRVSQTLKECEGAEHIYAFVSGNGVPYMHRHLIPYYSNTPKEFWSPAKIASWSGAPLQREKEIEL